MEETGEIDDSSFQVPELTPKEELVLEAPLDERSRKETEQFKSGDTEEQLKANSRVNEHGRTERFKDHFESLARIGITVAFGASIVLGVIWVWHIVSPAEWRWLQDKELEHLQNLITGGVLASLASDLFKRRLN
ncbi:MAG: hypothetical protein Q8K11_03225 [Phenylobacterium sp.]|uniref:hypothetical protein n=1 Tax=Phenylobacterium sp. TaxID=1871053 RepID=UPI00272F1CC3|nr:hypothetical protein [Phenylobacterium sp.]MDP2009168.1 hypothetical protein [Phenylobacterium sp.]